MIIVMISFTANKFAVFVKLEMMAVTNVYAFPLLNWKMKLSKILLHVVNIMVLSMKYLNTVGISKYS